MQQDQRKWLPPVGTKRNTAHWLENGAGKRVRAIWTGEHWMQAEEGWQQDGMRQHQHFGPQLDPELQPDWRYCEPADT